MKCLFFLVFFHFVLVACTDAVNTSNPKEEWDPTNNPKLMDMLHLTVTNGYNVTFDQLPLSGELETDVWAGSYWPTYQGGITQRWAEGYGPKRYAYEIKEYDADAEASIINLLSPAEKFDLYLGYKKLFPVLPLGGGRHYTPGGREMKMWDIYNPGWRDMVDWVGLTQYERIRTQIMKTVPDHEEYDPEFKIPTWEGLCHAWAPAAYLTKDPKGITVTGEGGVEIPFKASDLRALMTYFYHFNPAETSFLGGRCNADFSDLRFKLANGEISKEEFDKTLEALNCRDTNAGAFHVVLTNQIGIIGESFVADITRDLEVWNHPIKSYESEVVERREIENDAERIELNAAPDAVEIVQLRTKMNYVIERIASDRPSSTYPTMHTQYYQYRLELDEDGKILGGEWLQDRRPDFLWKQKRLEFTEPFLELKDLYDLAVAP